MLAYSRSCLLVLSAFRSPHSPTGEVIARQLLGEKLTLTIPLDTEHRHTHNLAKQGMHHTRDAQCFAIGICPKLPFAPLCIHCNGCALSNRSSPTFGRCLENSIRRRSSHLSLPYKAANLAYTSVFRSGRFPFPSIIARPSTRFLPTVTV